MFVHYLVAGEKSGHLHRQVATHFVGMYAW